MISENHEIFQQGKFEIIADPIDTIIIQRSIVGKTQRDIAVEAMTIPARPLLLHFSIRLIRFYQSRLSKKLGNRCVFDPSCSHYAEMALRKRGVFKGIWISIRRLWRCRPLNGGIDEI